MQHSLGFSFTISPAFQDRAFLGAYGYLRSAPLVEHCMAASAPISTNLLNPP
jgi:hypothetical protein